MNVNLVTGGAGFIGSSLVRGLLQDEHNTVINVDKLTYAGLPQSLDEVAHNPRYHFVQADIADQQAMREVFERHRPNRVFHLAAESHVDRSIAAADVFIHSNIVGSYVLLQVTRSYWSALPREARDNFRFIQVSTDEVYGQLPHPNQADGDPNKIAEITAQKFTEQTACAPNSPYSASKAAADHLARAWNHTWGMPIIVSRCSNNFGPRQQPEKLIPRVILNALAGQPLPIYGAGDQIRDWLYVDDHVSALLSLAERGRPGQSYNIGADNERQNLELVQTVCDLLEQLVPDKPSGVNHYRELMIHVEDRLGHDQRYAIDSSKIRREVGWQPTTDLTDGLRQTITWYIHHPQWCRLAQAALSDHTTDANHGNEVTV